MAVCPHLFAHACPPPHHHQALIGPTEVEGFFQGCGFNSSGMMLGGGAGRELAHWIHHGRPTVDMFSYEPSRFAREVSSDKSWVDERSHEAYAKVCLFPNPFALGVQ